MLGVEPLLLLLLEQSYVCLLSSSGGVPMSARIIGDK